MFSPPFVSHSFILITKDSGFSQKCLQGIAVNGSFIFAVSLPRHEGEVRGFTNNYWRKNIFSETFHTHIPLEG